MDTEKEALCDFVILWDDQSITLTVNATAGQNVGLVSQTQVTDKKVFYLSSLIVIIIGLFPKLSAIFLTIPYPVL